MSNRNKWRLYIDEVGNHDIKESLDPNERFLSLFGIWANAESIIDVIKPEMDTIKYEYFKSDPDNPVIFHRKDMVRKKKIFSCLFDEDLKKRFGDRMLRAFSEWPYIAAIVTIDKKEHLAHYGIWRYEPYHYCFETLIERYVLYLYYRNMEGDIMIESRDIKLDMGLKETFKNIYERGSDHVKADVIQTCLTSKELKLKKKTENITGLQLADLLAHPAHHDLLSEYGLESEHKSQFGKEIVKILRSEKYNRDKRTGKIDGFGIKLLP